MRSKCGRFDNIWYICWRWGFVQNIDGLFILCWKPESKVSADAKKGNMFIVTCSYHPYCKWTPSHFWIELKITLLPERSHIPYHGNFESIIFRLSSRWGYVTVFPFRVYGPPGFRGRKTGSPANLPWGIVVPRVGHYDGCATLDLCFSPGFRQFRSLKNICL